MHLEINLDMEVLHLQNVLEEVLERSSILTGAKCDAHFLDSGHKQRCYSLFFMDTKNYLDFSSHKGFIFNTEKSLLPFKY